MLTPAIKPFICPHCRSGEIEPPSGEMVASLERSTRVVKVIVVVLCPICEKTIGSNYFPHGELVAGLELKK